ncbi:tRNA uracil 4-sulfurtransferase ThiI [Haliangium ochraceum]|uniref:Probable tRNA sulfurtransferase n=1 Tax=Haliangium ochraceum (strain DSM 14365 / JCM 11303 / SMP-2) TaxID=502025 RepID=D0LKN2_HALO1|nr:tRNA uracil 4-sulfurtransferase ThiI [Haliangium ochraceum]ACY15080.1 thiamine biosynthesis/tRNA modification protein ThiI [Haliangium ochraceum DSM 14365]
MTSPDLVPSTDVVLLRISEIFLKGRNRNHFFSALVRHVRHLLADLEGTAVEAIHLRVMVTHPPALRARVLERLDRAFGTASMSLGTRVEASLDAFFAAAETFLAATPAGESFKLVCKRQDKRFPLSSDDIARELGARLVASTARPVDVHTPDHVIRVEVGRADQDEPSFVFGHTRPGPGGLPITTGGSVGLLLSGGIDSPVAGWSAMRRGCRVVAVYFHSFPYTGDKTKKKVLTLAQRLAAWQGSVPVHVVHFTEVQKALREHAGGRADLGVLMYRRMMLRAASRLALRDELSALVTGDSIGQVASQTVENLGVVEDAASVPVLRPLLTFDKAEIVERAQQIGTYEVSIQPYEDACALFVPKHPATRARVRDLRKVERGLDLEAMAQSLVDGAERIIVEAL